MDLGTYARLSEPAYLAELGTMPVAELRHKRGECTDYEQRLSYLRRLVQVRLDLVRAERSRRDEGEAPATLGDLLAVLPSTLDAASGPSRGAVASAAVDLEGDPTLTEELDRLCDSQRLATLGELPDQDLTALADELAELEHAVSERRAVVFDRLDTLTSELTRRYRTGEARADDALQS